MNTSFGGIRIAYHDEGEGQAVILLHGGYVDGLGQFGDFERILPLLKKQHEMFREVFAGALPLPNPPLEGRPGPGPRTSGRGRTHHPAGHARFRSFRQTARENSVRKLSDGPRRGSSH